MSKSLPQEFSDIHSHNNDLFVPVTGSISLAKFVKLFSTPKIIRVKGNYHSPLGTLTLAVGQLLVVVDVVQMRVLTGVDGSDEVFKVTEDSDLIKFAPMIEGMKSEYSTPQLLKAKSLPPAVAPTSPFDDASGYKIPGGTILYLNTTKPSALASVLRSDRRSVKALSNLGEVVIKNSCQALFSTSERDVTLPPSDLMKYIQLPVMARPVSDDDDIDSIPYVHLREVHSENVLIALLKFEEMIEMPLLEIPVSLNLFIEVMEPRDKREMEHIYCEARADYENITELRKKLLRNKSSGQLDSITSCQASEGTSLAMCSPPLPPKIPPKLKSQKSMGNVYSESPSETSPQPPCLPTTGQKESVESQRVYTEAENRSYLKDLSCMAVQHLLEALDLHSYKGAFLAEQVNGQIFVCLNDEMLTELGAVSYTHLTLPTNREV